MCSSEFSVFVSWSGRIALASQILQFGICCSLKLLLPSHLSSIESMLWEVEYTLSSGTLGALSKVADKAHVCCVQGTVWDSAFWAIPKSFAKLWRPWGFGEHEKGRRSLCQMQEGETMWKADQNLIEFVGACVNFMAVPVESCVKLWTWRFWRLRFWAEGAVAGVRTNGVQAYFLDSHPDGGTAGAKMGCRWVAVQSVVRCDGELCDEQVEITLHEMYDLKAEQPLSFSSLAVARRNQRKSDPERATHLCRTCRSPKISHFEWSSWFF